MTEHKNNLNLTQAIPLQDKKVPENFYAGADRGEVLLRMTKALEQGVALLVLSGEEGSGKTMICRLLEREAARFCFTVFLSKNVESFEDVVRKVAMQLGLATDGHEGKNIDKTLDKITAHLKRESTGLLIIFDESENIYLATLERIRKMLDRITQAGARLQIAFSGRKAFLDSFAQLSVYFKNTNQLQFDLMPLTEQETGEYLNALAMEAEISDRRVFNDEIVRNIFSLAQGNFGRTRLLAEESWRTHGDDTSFMVLLENVKEEVGERRGKRKRPERPKLLKRSAQYLPWAGGIGCALLLLFFVMKPGEGDQRDEKVEAQRATVERVEVVEAVKLPEEKKVEEKVAATPQEDQKAPPTEQEQVRESLSSDSSAESSHLELLSDRPAAEKLDDSFEEKPAARGVPTPDVAKVTSDKVVPSSVNVSIPPSQPLKVKQLTLDRPVKIKKVLTADKGGKTTIRVQPPAVKENIAANTQLSVDQMLKKRMAAGSAWSRKEKEDAYTMQLMALTDKNAEDNLKKMLAQPQYRQESGSFYIFKKSPGSPVVFVFYGEYPTLAMARAAQNTLPPFLQAHQPYAISIKGAMAKVRK